MNAVEVGNVDTPLIWWRVAFAVLIDVKGKENDINTIDLLKNNNTFASEWELDWIVFVSIPFLHSLSNFELPVH